MRKLVVFDFDGTLTKKDTMIEFTRFYWGDLRFFLGMLYLSPVLLAYKTGWLPNWRAKELFLTHFFRNEPESGFQEACSRFGLEKIPAMIRPLAARRLEEHRKEGARLVVVSSSAENWLSAWCRQENLSLIGTRLNVRNGRLTGKLEGPNCYGAEKVRRLRQAYRLQDYSEIIAYGDSKGDLPLLELATAAHYKPFRK